MQFSDWADKAGLNAIAGPTYVSSWLDIDLDGVAEPAWFSQASVFYLDWDAGEPELREAVVTNPHPGFSPSPEIQMVIAVGDFSRVGLPEVIVFASTMRRYRVTAPGELTFMAEQDPPLPAGLRPFDAAVGDVNGDAWPDIVLAMGRISTEHIYELGHRDVVFMNRGGEFESVRLEPSRIAQSNGITMVDLNGDQRLDLVESIDFSGASGPARILINQTEAGAQEPTFVVANNTYDVSSFGMGAAIEDVDQDGLLDIYNASTGQDFLMFQESDGSFEDRTWAAGIAHEWGTDGGRIQWAPSLVDLDADGDIDIFVRHGHLTNTLLANFGFVPIAQQNIVYTQEPDGTFQRVAVPFDADASHGGVDAATGDLEGDGLPDVTMGTQYLKSSNPPGEGIPIFWHNETPLEANQRPYVVTLHPSVSASPPTGAQVIGTCDGQTQTRHLTSGGRMGAMGPSSLHFAWVGCEGQSEFEVRWPSGAVSLHEVEEVSGRVIVTEPHWMTLNAAGTGVSLTPEGTGNSDVCYAQSPAGPFTCCEEAPCDVSRPLGFDQRLALRLGTSGPVLALPPAQGWFTLRTFPELPAPGLPFTLRVTQREQVIAEVPWIRINGSKVPWDVENTEEGIFEAVVEGAQVGEVQDTRLFVASELQGIWDISSGLVLGSTPDDFTVYPYQNAAGDGAWSMLFAPGSSSGFSELLNLGSLQALDQNAEVVPTNTSVALLGRVQIRIPWKYLEAGDEITLYDDTRAFLGPLPVYLFTDFDEVEKRISGTRGLLSRIFPVEGGDRIRIFFTLLDEDNRALPPDPSLCLVTVEGAVPMGPVEVLPGGWELSVGFRTEPGVGPGHVTVSKVDGTVLKTFAFTRRERADRPADLSLSSVSVSEETLPAGVGATAELQIFARNKFNELLGMDADVHLKAPAALSITKPALHVMGYFTATVSTSYYGGSYPIEVWSHDLLLDTVHIEVIGPSPPESPQHVSWPDTIGSEPDAFSETSPSPDPPDGCEGGRAKGPSPTLWVLGLLLLLGRRRRDAPV